MWKEFKEFAVKGNVIDLAVGVIIGGAFGKIVTSLVQDMLMPLIAMLVGGKNSFSKFHYGDVAYGKFIESVVDFFIIAFSVFLFVKIITRFKKKEAPVVKKIDRTEELLGEIRDLLKEEKESYRNNETS